SPLGHLDGGEGFGQGADLVDLDQYGVRNALVDALLQDLGVGDKKVVAHQLHPLAQLFGQDLPAFPVVLGHAVFDGNDGVLVAPGGEQVGKVLRGQRYAAFTRQIVFTVTIEFGAGAVQAQRDL